MTINPAFVQFMVIISQIISPQQAQLVNRGARLDQQGRPAVKLARLGKQAFKDQQVLQLQVLVYLGQLEMLDPVALLD